MHDFDYADGSDVYHVGMSGVPVLGYDTPHSSHSPHSPHSVHSAHSPHKGGQRHQERYSGYRYGKGHHHQVTKSLQGQEWHEEWSAPSVHAQYGKGGKYGARHNEADELAGLIGTVKELQRDSRWHTRWADYCHVYGEGTRDPTRHSPQFLRDSITKLQGDHTKAKEHRNIVAKIKDLQKADQAWNGHWQRYLFWGYICLFKGGWYCFHPGLGESEVSASIAFWS